VCIPRPPIPTLFPYTTLFRSRRSVRRSRARARTTTVTRSSCPTTRTRTARRSSEHDRPSGDVLRADARGGVAVDLDDAHLAQSLQVEVLAAGEPERVVALEDARGVRVRHN